MRIKFYRGTMSLDPSLVAYPWQEEDENGRFEILRGPFCLTAEASN